MTRAHEEVIDFIAGGTSPAAVAEFRPSEEAKRRVMTLVQREKTGELTPEEATELNDALHLEHLMRLAKARARRYLDQE